MILVSQMSFQVLTHNLQSSYVLAKPTVSCMTATHEAWLQKICAAARIILECLGEDPNRESPARTLEQYVQALMRMNRGCVRY